MFKQLDKLMAKSFIGPFVVTFAIAMFVLLMQILWVYLDDIAGKGLGFFLIMELMAYKCVGLVPLALPLALLISSVMVMGGMAEHYELSSFKSAGVSLLRLMAPLIFFGVLSAGISYATNDYVIPAANLQFGSRMYDIQSKKPTLNMEPGVFNEDFQNFAIRLGGRSDNGRDISDVLIYDHSKATTGELSEIVAKTGEMFSPPNTNYFVMNLYDGHQYVEQRSKAGSSGSTPFTRTSFDSYTKIFDLSEFDLKRHSTNLFSQNRSMLATWQLQQGVDSIDLDLAEHKQTISNHVTAYLTRLPKDERVIRPLREEERLQREADQLRRDSLQLLGEAQANNAYTSSPPATAQRMERLRGDKGSQYTTSYKTPVDQREKLRLSRQQQALDHYLVKDTEAWPGLNALLMRADAVTRKRFLGRTESNNRSIVQQAKNTVRLLPGIRETRVKHVYDLHMKYSMALVCIIFIFIGAPMGAIVRKGGFGYPILVSVIFFVIFIILTIFCRKLAESFVVGGALAGWLPCIILFPVSLWITLRAMKDAKLVNTEAVGNVVRQLRARVGKQAASL